MPTIPHYNLDVDDLVGMDYLTFAKKRMIRDMKTDRSVENADKYIIDTSFKDTGDASSTINNIKEISKLLNNSYNLLSQIGNKITKPRDVNAPFKTTAFTTPSPNGFTSLIREDANISTDIIDKSNTINSNFIQIIDFLNIIINNPSTIKKIPQIEVVKIFSFIKKWILKFLGDNPNRWTGVVSSQVLRIIPVRAIEGYTRLIGYDRLIAEPLTYTTTGALTARSKSTGFVNVETICDNFEEMLKLWYNFRDIWRIFIRIYNAEPA